MENVTNSNPYVCVQKRKSKTLNLCESQSIAKCLQDHIWALKF